jgi:hypothetical protein
MDFKGVGLTECHSSAVNTRTASSAGTTTTSQATKPAAAHRAPSSAPGNQATQAAGGVGAGAAAPDTPECRPQKRARRGSVLHATAELVLSPASQRLLDESLAASPAPARDAAASSAPPAPPAPTTVEEAPGATPETGCAPRCRAAVVIFCLGKGRFDWQRGMRPVRVPPPRCEQLVWRTY